MKKKKILLISIIGLAVLIAVATTITLILVFGNKLDKCSTKINESMETVVSIDSQVVLKDADVVVYKYNKNIKFKENNQAEVNLTKASFNSNFELEETSTFEIIENVDRSTLIKMVLDKDYFEEYDINKDVLTFKVSKDNISNVFPGANLDIKDSAIFTITFTDDLIVSLTCTYQTSTSKDVMINISYKY